ncbi:sialidase family protein [Halorientalis pallida]|nr:sialidase family protein [Halorientalis pallida]
MDETGREWTSRRRLLQLGGVGMAAIGGCLARFGGFNDGDYRFETSDIFVSGEDGYTRYRIPALQVTERGTLLAFCEGRRGEGNDRSPTDLLLKRSEDGGATWTDQLVVYSEGDKTISNPTPVVDQSSGRIYLPLCREYRDVLMTRSADDGRTWDEPREITSSVKRDGWKYYATGPGVGIQLRREPYSGRLVIPATHWNHFWEGEIPDDNVMYDHIIYSDDGGTTWELGGTVGEHVDEPQAVELTDGRIMMNMRSTPGSDVAASPDGNYRAVATSADGGGSWSDISYDETLVTPTCQGSFVRYSWPDEGRSRILFANPGHEDSRVDLTIRLSYDAGESWEYSKVLYGSRAAYSSLAVLPDGSVGCLFERGTAFSSTYEHLTFCRFTIEWLTDGADTPRAN